MPASANWIDSIPPRRAAPPAAARPAAHPPGYGHDGVPGRAAGYLDNPDGVDLAPPD
jgi:hypothetical protein